MIKNTEKLNLRYIPEDEAVEIFKAWRRGDKLEIYKGDGVWRRIESSVHMLERANIYRIPARPPAFDNWHLLPDWARYIAQDEDGTVIIYENEPSKFSGMWAISGGTLRNITGFRLGYDPGTGGWENSMIEKTEGV